MSDDRGSPAADKVITVSYPTIVPVRLPDTSMLKAAGGVLSDELALLTSAGDTGLDIVSPACDAQGNPSATAPDLFKLTEVADYVNTGGAANVRLSTDRDGTKHYTDLGDDSHLRMTVRRDGSGTLTDLGGDRHLSVIVNKDGSGKLTDLGGDRHLTIIVNPDRSGHLTDLGGDRHLTIDVAANGTGRLTDLGGDRHLTIIIPAKGQAELTDLGGDRNLRIAVAGDGSGHYRDLGGDRNLEFAREQDGSLTMRNIGGDNNFMLEVKSDRSGRLQDVAHDLSFDFGPDGRATDGSGYVIRLPEAPVLSAPDVFPPLGRLGRLRPPCATVLRFTADVLFDFDKATLKPEAKKLVADTAAVLAKAGAPIRVDGHTDAKGSDAYNDDLSKRRAEAFAAALKDGGVTVDITATGWGEKRPVAPNTTADGKDNPSGRAQNRRVEVVLKN